MLLTKTRANNYANKKLITQPASTSYREMMALQKQKFSLTCTFVYRPPPEERQSVAFATEQLTQQQQLK